MAKQTISIKDLARGIDAYSAQNNIQDGYSADLVNVDVNDSGYVQKRRGYEGYLGHLPLRANSFKHKNNISRICFDSAAQLTSQAPQPIVVYGETEGTIYSGLLSKYYSSYVNRIILASAGSNDLFRASDLAKSSTDYLFALAFSSSTSNKSWTLPTTEISKLEIDTLTFNTEIEYTVGTNKNCFVYTRDASALAGTRYIKSDSQIAASTTSTITIPASSHGLVNFNILPTFYRRRSPVSSLESLDIDGTEIDHTTNKIMRSTFDPSPFQDDDKVKFVYLSGGFPRDLQDEQDYYIINFASGSGTYEFQLSETQGGSAVNFQYPVSGSYRLDQQNFDESAKWEEFTPDTFTVDRETGEVDVEVTNSESYSIDVKTILEAVPNTNVIEISVDGSSSETATFSNGEFNFVAAYEKDYSGMTDDNTLISPTSISYDSSNGQTSVEITNGSGSLKVYRIHYVDGVELAGCISIEQSGTNAEDDLPRLDVWGLPQASLYLNKTQREGFVAHLDTYKTDDEEFLVASRNGVLYKAADKSIDPTRAGFAKVPSAAASLEGYTYDNETIGPLFHETGSAAFRTEGTVKADDVEDNRALATGCNLQIQDITSLNYINLGGDLGLNLGAGVIGLVSGDQIMFKNPGDGSSLPTGLSYSTVYYVDVTDDAAGELKLATDEALTTNIPYVADSSGTNRFLINNRTVIQLQLTNKNGNLESSINSSDDIPDYLTVTNFAHDFHNGTFQVMYVSNGLNRIAVRNTSEIFDNYQIFDESGARGRVGVFTNRIRLKSQPFSSGDSVTISGIGVTSEPILGLRDISSPAEYRISIGGVTSSLTIVPDSQVVGSRTSATIPMNSTEGYLVGDMTTVTGLSRRFRVDSVDTGAGTITLDESILFTGGGDFFVTGQGRWFPIERPMDIKLLGVDIRSSYLNNDRTRYYFSENTPLNQPDIKSVVINDSMLLTNGFDDVRKFDGSNIYKAGLFKWSPQLFCQIDTNVASLTEDAFYPYTKRTKSVDGVFDYADPTAFVAGDRVVDEDTDEIYTVREVDVENKKVYVLDGGDLIKSTEYEVTPAECNASSNTFTVVGHGYSNGDQIILTSNDNPPAGLTSGNNYYIINSTTDTFQLSATPSGSVAGFTDSGTGTHTIAQVLAGINFSLRKVKRYRYYFKIVAKDANGFQMASAVTGYDDFIIELRESGRIQIRLLGLPEWRDLDYEALEVEVYRTTGTGQAPFYFVKAVDLSFEKTEGYVTFYDSISDDILVNQSIDGISSQLTGVELPNLVTAPPRGKSITTVNNKLAIANFKDYPTLDLVFKSSRVGGAVSRDDFDGKKLLLRKSSTDTNSATDNLNRYNYQFVKDTTFQIFAIEAVGDSKIKFLASDITGTEEVIQGDWMYVHHDAPGTKNDLNFTGWHRTPDNQNGLEVTMFHSLGGDISDLDLTYNQITSQFEIDDFDLTSANFTDDSGDLLVTIGSHGLENGDILQFSSTGSLPTGLSTATDYYIIEKTSNTMKLATSAGGTAISYTDSGSGTITATHYTAGGDVVKRWTIPGHGFSNGDRLSVASSNTVSVIEEEVDYYVVRSTSAYIRIATTASGAPLGGWGATGTHYIRKNWDFPNRIAIAENAKNVPVFIGEDGNYNQVGANTTTYSNFISRLASAINASMRKNSITESIVTPEEFEPWVVADTSDGLEAGRLLLRSERAGYTFSVVFPEEISTTDYFAQERRRTALESVESEEKQFPSRLAVSFPNYPEIFNDPYGDDRTNGLVRDINPADGEEITAIIPFFGESVFQSSRLEDILVVFKTNSIYLAKMPDTPNGEPQVSKLDSRGLGCTAPKSVASTKDGVIFANNSGVYRLNRDQTISYVGKYLKRMWEDDTNLDRVSECAGHHYSKDQKYKLSYVDVGGTTPTKVFVYDHEREGKGQEYGAWTRYTNHDVTWWVNSQQEAFFSTTDGQVFQVRNRGSADDFRDDGDAVDTMEIITKAFDYGLSGIRKFIQSIVTHFQLRKTSNENTTISTAKDLSNTFDNLGIVAMTQDEGRSVSSRRTSVDTTKAEHLQVKYTNSTKDEDVVLTGVDFEVSGLNNKGIREQGE